MQIMFPMVGTIDDVRAGNAAVEKVKADLRSEGIPFDEKIKVGIMIEIPSIAMIADMAALETDFASVGTNDLTQYLHAVDRMNPKIVSYYQSYSPAMYRILGKIFLRNTTKLANLSRSAVSWRASHWRQSYCLGLACASSA